MKNDKPLWERLYHDECWIELARLVGYAGLTYRDLITRSEPLRQKFGNQRVDSATYQLTTFEGQMTVNPKPLADVQLRPEIRKLCWQLLGPPPEAFDWFCRYASGEPTPEHAEKMSQTGLKGTPEQKPKKARKKK